MLFLDVIYCSFYCHSCFVPEIYFVDVCSSITVVCSFVCLMFVCLVVISGFVPFAMTQLHPIQIRKWAVVERKTWCHCLMM